MRFPPITDPGIQADWLEDQGFDRRLANPPLGYFTCGDGYGDGYGDGSGYGYGSGGGSGGGYGDGYGYGDGSGDGDGYGYGDGSGDGDGYGDGDGDGDDFSQPKGNTMPIVGERMLIFCGLSFAFVGDVIEQLGPYQFRLSNASMLCRTGGIPWDDLAEGKSRNQATFRYQGTISVGPFFSWARAWTGELPGKDHKCK